jgi:hypothetical protein
LYGSGRTHLGGELADLLLVDALDDFGRRRHLNVTLRRLQHDGAKADVELEIVPRRDAR